MGKQNSEVFAYKEEIQRTFINTMREERWKMLNGIKKIKGNTMHRAAGHTSTGIPRLKWLPVSPR